jgi:hypothetical protein
VSPSVEVPALPSGRWTPIAVHGDRQTPDLATVGDWRLVVKIPNPTTRTARIKRSVRHAQRFLFTHCRIHDRFQLRRHLSSAPDHRTNRTAAFRIWHESSASM